MLLQKYYAFRYRMTLFFKLKNDSTNKMNFTGNFISIQNTYKMTVLRTIIDKKMLFINLILFVVLITVSY